MSTKHTVSEVQARVRLVYGETLTDEEARKFWKNEQRVRGTVLLKTAEKHPGLNFEFVKALAKDETFVSIARLVKISGGTAKSFANFNVDEYVSPLIKSNTTVFIPGGGMFRTGSYELIDG